MPELQNNSAQIYKKLLRFFLEREIANFYEFLKTLDESLDVRQQTLSKDIDAINSDLKIIEKYDQHRKELINLKVEAEQVKGFTNLLRQSFLTSLYSFVELWLLRACHLDSKRRDGGQSYDSIQKDGMEKAKRYFTSIIGSDYPFGSSQDWLWIKNFQSLRNCIIHRQGSLSGFSNFDVDQKLVAFVKNEEHLSLFGVDNQQIFIEIGFCIKALQIVHRFMVELLDLEIHKD